MAGGSGAVSVSDLRIDYRGNLLITEDDYITEDDPKPTADRRGDDIWSQAGMFARSGGG